ncbi:MAG: hypothetical protein B7Y25_03925 [Alphaproteobacteria bacterium 16-39-46]|nr:MAG: hypothetical protein B7Y25_03925 [Alphaproteobacteria bacterium 16-39-46]OZA43126.1 MAG: hypothetical protein B7X84_04050 [Alphaproteobacteria bacterium 17-39-52]HQS84027.1 ETC complex I subunit [Alphaproteobacteria bacterium]HQS93630.1 ETC complex I subunit [Alphaproteobacteria bacterium]
MSHAHIYKPCKSASQSGRALTHHWVLRFDATALPQKNPTTGWIPLIDMLEEVFLTFPTLEEAIRFAETKGLSYTIQEPAPQKTPLKSYSDNFRFDRKRF